MKEGRELTLRPSPARAARVTVLALALGGLGSWMFYFGGIRSGAVIALVLGFIVLLLAAWLESQLFSFVRLRDRKLTAYSLVGGRRVVPASDITMLVPHDFTAQRTRHFLSFGFTRHTLEVHTVKGSTGILLDINGFGEQKIKAFVAELGVPVSGVVHRTDWSV